jgi:hypothetical protein
MFVQFSPMRLTEYPDARAFNFEVGPWLVQREAENCYMLGDLPRLIWEHDQGKTPKPRLFSFKDKEQIVSAMLIHPQGGLVTTWTAPDIIPLLVEQTIAAGVQISSVFGPGYVSWQFAAEWAKRLNLRWEAGREERVYQLARVRHELPASGRLIKAGPDHAAFVLPWMEAFAREAEYQQASALGEIRDSLIKEGRLYLWCNPQPQAMAAWVSPTPNGGSINFVYVPAEFRGRGNGKHVTAALANHVLGNGSRYCFILTDTGDKRSNHLYQGIGARTVAELLQCSLHPLTNPAPRSGGGGRLSIINAPS